MMSGWEVPTDTGTWEQSTWSAPPSIAARLQAMICRGLVGVYTSLFIPYSFRAFRMYRIQFGETRFPKRP
jgi:hypothetical protein